MIQTIQDRAVRYGKYVFLGLLAYAPLHIFISIVIGANLGGLSVLKMFKDIVLLFGFCLVFFSSITKPWFVRWLRQPLVVLIAAYALLTTALALLRPTELDAELLGITYNLRFLLFFLYGWLLTRWYPPAPLLKTAAKITLITASVVVGFGLVQYWFLPNDALTHLGFTKANGVFPAFFIDDKPNLERVMSTVRDPNSLGSYLIIIASLLGTLLLRVRKEKRQLFGGALLATVLCLFLTFSRSALLGLLLAAIILGIMFGRQHIKLAPKTLRTAALLGVAAGLLIAGGLFVAKDSYFVQNVIFHADASTVQEDPNQLRVRFAQESVQTIVDHPTGLGPGTAGLASIKNQTQGTKLNENYYLQIATEVGILGLLLFLSILTLTARHTYGVARGNIYATALLAAFAGLAFTNLLVHIWSNEAVAYTWWGLAGLANVHNLKKSKNN